MAEETNYPVATMTKEELIKKLQNGEKLTDLEIARLKELNDREDTSKIDRIVRGVNDVFKKHYDFNNEYGVEFDLAVRAPNAIESGRIQGRREAYLEGMGMAVGRFHYDAFHMLATIRICGVEVPKCLENDEDIYNLGVLYTIAQDYQEWLSFFRF